VEKPRPENHGSQVPDEDLDGDLGTLYGASMAGWFILESG
jgi:hypothetical protein